MLVLVSAFVLPGCSSIEYRKVEVNPYVLPQIPAEQKFPVTVALVLDEDLKGYLVKHELIALIPGTTDTAGYQVGPHLDRYARDVTSSLFQNVEVVNSFTEAIGRCNAIVIPKAVRSSTHITTPKQVMLVIEWKVLDRSGKDLIWLTSVESHASVVPGAFAAGKAWREVYTLVLSDLASKTIASFQASPEIRAISTHKEVK
jgi:hypothetical protein